MNGITPIEQLEISKIADVGQESLTFAQVKKLSKDRFDQQLCLFQKTMLAAFCLSDSNHLVLDQINNTHLHAKNGAFSVARGVASALKKVVKIESNVEVSSCIHDTQIYVFVSCDDEHLGPELEAALKSLVTGFYPSGDDPGVCESGIMLKDYSFRGHPLWVYILGERLEVGFIKKNSSLLREDLVEMCIGEIKPLKRGKFSAEIRSCISSIDKTEISTVGKSNAFYIDRKFEDWLHLLAFNNSTYQGKFHLEEYLDSRLFRLVISEKEEQIFEKYAKQLIQVNAALKSELNGLKTSAT